MFCKHNNKYYGSKTAQGKPLFTDCYLVSSTRSRIHFVVDDWRTGGSARFFDRTLDRLFAAFTALLTSIGRLFRRSVENLLARLCLVPVFQLTGGVDQSVVETPVDLSRSSRLLTRLAILYLLDILGN